MSKERITIKFNSLHQLWLFAQNIKARNIEIKTHEHLLVCDCTDDDLPLIAKHGGRKIELLSERNN